MLRRSPRCPSGRSMLPRRGCSRRRGRSRSYCPVLAVLGRKESIARRIRSVAATLPNSKAATPTMRRAEPAVEETGRTASRKGSVLLRRRAAGQCGSRRGSRAAASSPGMTRGGSRCGRRQGYEGESRAVVRRLRRGCPSALEPVGAPVSGGRHDVGEQRVACGHAQAAGRPGPSAKEPTCQAAVARQSGKRGRP